MRPSEIRQLRPLAKSGRSDLLVGLSRLAEAANGLRELAERSAREPGDAHQATRLELERQVPAILEARRSVTVDELAELLGVHRKTAYRVAHAVAGQDGGVLIFERVRNVDRLRLVHPDAKAALAAFLPKSS